MTTRRTVFLTGATGLLGASLVARWEGRGQRVRALCRQPKAQTGEVTGTEWITGDITRAGDWQRAVEGVDGVVHLAGEPIAQRRWTPARKAALRASRIEGTARLVQAMVEAEHPPTVFVCASASGYYGACGETELDESSPPGKDFLAELARDWEQTALLAEQAGIRVILLRFGTILSRQGGALPRMLRVFRMGLGGPMGSGANFVPWIHLEDAVGLVDWALNTQEIAGAVNAVSPMPVRMTEFARAMGRAVHRPAVVPIPVVLLKLLLGELGGSLFPGQRIVPRVALNAGYVFRHEEIYSALASLVE